MKIWFTITGTCFHYGHDFLEKGMKVRLEKEPDNEYDREAIKVMMDGFGLVGYVANSPKTVIGESYSAGRLYDKIGDTAAGKGKYVTDRGVLCSLKLKGVQEPETGGESASRKAPPPPPDDDPDEEDVQPDPPGIVY